MQSRYSDMEQSKAMKAAIQSAAMKAKLLFDTYQWKWGMHPETGEAVPSINEIVTNYNEMVERVLEGAIQVVDGKTVGKGNMMRGRLTCEFTDEIWSFGVELASTFTDEPMTVFAVEYVEGIPKKPLANLSQMGN